MALKTSPVTQSPKAYDLANLSAPQILARFTNNALAVVLNRFKTTAAETAGAIVPTDSSFDAAPYDIRRYGASKGASNAVNKAALQTAILACSGEGATSGGTVLVPPNINYGYKVTDSTTWPDFSACVAPCVVIDYGPGASFAGFPTTYDGAQLRTFYFTPQTTAAVTFTGAIAGAATSATLSANWPLSTGPWRVTFSNGDVRYVTFTLNQNTATWTTGLTAGGATANATYLNQGQHEGNTEFLRGAWNPGLFISNDAAYPAPGSATRTALDNRRCQLSFGNDGSELWKIGQGTLAGASLTDEVLSNFALQKVNAPGDTIGAYVPFVIERKTGNWTFGGGTNVPLAAYYFWNVTAGYNCALFENQWATDATVVYRCSLGSAGDVYFANQNGNIALGNTHGNALTVDKVTRAVSVGQTLVQLVEVIAYSALMTPNASTGNIKTIAATNATAFTITNPSNALSGTKLTITVKNTSGGALGAVSWGALYKMAAWVSPANGFSRSITFYFDNTNWIEMSRTPADVPN
jgi:hypothetical protein